MSLEPYPRQYLLKLLESMRRLWRDDASQHILTRWLFVRILGLIYFIAFVSLGTQVDGLIGRNGILPAAEFMEAVHRQLGVAHWWEVPTLCWFSASDGSLHFLCYGGALVALLVVAGILQGPGLLMLWVFYLSLFWVGRDFLGFQWDILLLEMGFLAVFFAPWKVFSRLRGDTPPSRLTLWLLRWLLFRLMFASGVVKLTSHDPLWRDLTALNVHYETQPLPTWIGWYVHQMPAWFQKTSVGVMFFIELVIPFCIFAPRCFRHIACGFLAFLQFFIIATGNYCFFNLITLALCLLLLDDAALLRLCPAKWRVKVARPSVIATSPPWRLYLVATITVPLLVLGGCTMMELLVPRKVMPVPLMTFQRVAAPWCLVNGYGLFATMTTPRNEIVVEGSNDGVHWEAYEFKWKPGDPGHAPGFVAPHQPRLDWQMWFAALGNYQANQWFISFLRRLLQGTPEVLALMEKNPFPDRPPRYVRALFYEYHFTDFATRRQTGDWWRREAKGLYCPPLTLQGATP